MWRDLEWPVKSYGAGSWQFFRLDIFNHLRTPAYSSGQNREAYEALSALTDAALAATDFDPTDHIAFCEKVGNVAYQIAKGIEDRQNFQLVSEINNLMEVWAEVEPMWGFACTGLVQLVHLLCGTEKRYMFGVRRGRPAWKRAELNVWMRRCEGFQRAMSVEDDFDLTRLWPSFMGYGSLHFLPYLDQTDAEFYPTVREWHPLIGEDGTPVREVESKQITDLLEDAYYRQRYMVHPAGAYVKLRHLPPFSGMLLKVKPGLRDPNYIDIVTQFEIDPGMTEAAPADEEQKKLFFVLDGTFTVEDLPLYDRNQSGVFYLSWVVALVYHDLVTAKEITVVSREDAESARQPVKAIAQREEETEPSWVYIPRKFKRRDLQPRSELTERRLLTPHHVTGHLRKGNLSEEHQRELAKWERQTGLQVLPLLERMPGYTFVRPHVSPSADGLTDLPRFIHARLQSEIDALMRPIE